MLEGLVVLVGLGRLLTLVGLVVFFLLAFPLLVREPARWQLGFFKALAYTAVLTVLLEFLLRGPSWLHASYGLISALLLLCVSGLEPGGWFRRGLPHSPERVGQYFFWASFVGFLLWERFIQTG